MANKTAILAVKVVSDTTKAKQGFEETASAVEKFEQGLNKVTPVAAVALGGIALLGKGAIDAASQLEQSTGAVASVFSNHAQEIYNLAEKSAQSVGLAKSQYQDLATIVGAQLKNMGLPMEEVTGQTQTLINIGSDLAATFGGETSDAVAAISSLLRGERDPIERYGVAIKAADIQARLAAQGLDKLDGEARKQAETQATLALLMEQTKDAQGAFAREADTAAGAQQRANAAWENAKAKLGEHLLPVVTTFTQALTDAANWISENDTLTLGIIGTIGAFAAGILTLNAALQAYKAIQTAVKIATTVWTAAQAALNFILNANPIGLVVSGIAVLAAGIYYAYNHSETFRNGVNRMWEAIKAGAAWCVSVMQPIIDAFWSLVGAVQTAYNWVTNLFSSVKAPEWLSTIAGYIGFTAPAALNASTAPMGITYQPTSIYPKRPSKPESTGTTINITVNGAIDPHSTARQIQKILSQHQRAISGVAL